MEINVDLEKIINVTEKSWEFLEKNKEDIAIYSLYTVGIVSGIVSLLPLDLSVNEVSLCRALLTGLTSTGYLLARHYENNQPE